jgi:thioredoxin-like negative regulator of GroEL
MAGRAAPSTGAGNERIRIAGSEIQDRRGLLPRLQDYDRRVGGPVRGDAGRFMGDRTQRHPPVVYRDRPDLIRYDSHSVYTYRDRYDRLCHRIIWPRFYYPIYYSFGPYYGFNCVYPYYHRKYVFVSLGGYWPTSYSYMRYYWYGSHPYVWHGYYPIPREVNSDTYNYYTYNYYVDQDGSYTGGAYYTDSTDSSALPYGIDAETYAKVQKRLVEQQSREPSAQTRVDTLFDAGVKGFEAGNYADAASQFAAAMELASDDVILPYAYAQALFASGQYSKAAEVLRGALSQVSPSDEGVFYPRGLYPDDDTLFEQVEDLLDKVEDYSYDTDMQLLLGYNLLGIGETDYARAPLERAAQDFRNARAAKVLLNLVKKLEAAAVTEGSAANVRTDAAAAAPSGAEPETMKRITEALDRTEAAVRSNVATPQPEAGASEAGLPMTPVDVDSMTPNRPDATGPDTQPDNLGAGSVGISDDLQSPGSVPPVEADVAGGTLTAALIDRSATPAMIALLGGATFCLVRADRLVRHRTSG